MKQIICFHLIFILPNLGSAQGKEQIWTTNDRQLLLTGLKVNESNFLKEIEGLTNEQIHFKPDSSQWSVAEVIEHFY